MITPHNKNQITNILYLTFFFLQQLFMGDLLKEVNAEADERKLLNKQV